MNKVKAKGGNFLWTKKKNTIRSNLPHKEIGTEIQHWWVINVGYVSEDDIQKSSKVEHTIIDLLIDSGAKLAGQLPKPALQSLLIRGLVYVDVPIENNDQILVPHIKDFVMNRVSGDYFENLLYKIFISVDERTTIEKLSKILDIDITLVKQAVSMYIRLGLAKKKNVEPLIPAEPLDDISRSLKPKWHSTWVREELSRLKKEQDMANDESLPDAPLSSISTSPKSDNDNKLLAQDPDEDQVSEKKRIAFLFDAALAAILMMGNLGENLKQHAVMMFEVGKLPDERLNDFIRELDNIQVSAEGEAQRYFDHAITLKNTLKFLRYNDQIMPSISDGGIDLLRCERLNSLDPGAKKRILNETYSLLISTAPISGQNLTISSQAPLHFGPVIPEMASPWFKLFLYKASGAGPESILYPRGHRVTCIPHQFRDCEMFNVITWESEQSIILQKSSMIPALNDLLLNSPVLIQGYSYTKQMPKIIDIAFPIENTLVEYGSSEKDYNEDNLHTHPSLKKLQEKVNISNSCGVIKMILLENPKTNESRWVPFDIFFGIPLYSSQLNQRVCMGIEKYNILSDENLKIYSKSSRELALRFLHFISQSVQGKLELGTKVIYPTKVVQFTNKSSNSY